MLTMTVQMFNMYYVSHVYHLSLACSHAEVSSLALNTSEAEAAIREFSSQVLQVFDYN